MSSCLHAPPSVGTLRLEGLRLPLPMTVTPLSPLRGKLGDLVCKSTAAVQCDASSSSTISVMHSKRPVLLLQARHRSLGHFRFRLLTTLAGCKASNEETAGERSFLKSGKTIAPEGNDYLSKLPRSPKASLCKDEATSFYFQLVG